MLKTIQDFFYTIPFIRDGITIHALYFTNLIYQLYINSGISIEIVQYKKDTNGC